MYKAAKYIAVYVLAFCVGVLIGYMYYHSAIRALEETIFDNRQLINDVRKYLPRFHYAD